MSEFIIALKIQFLRYGNQSIFHLFWPILRIYSPIAIAAFSFGKILESGVESKLYTYHQFVAVGILVWLALSTGLQSNLRLLSSKNKRILALASKSFFYKSFLVPYIFISPLFLYSSFLLITNVDGLSLRIYVALVISLMTYILVTISLYLSIIFSILSALTRDVRFVVPYLLQVLLLASPVFYTSKVSNSFSERIWEIVNPLDDLLRICRYVILQPNNKSVVLLVLISSSMSIFIINKFLSSLAFHTAIRIDFIFGDKGELDEDANIN